MSSPTPADGVLVRPEAVTALAGELSVLAAELSDDADLCRAAARSLSAALDGVDGWTAGATAAAWAGLAEVLADRADALAAILTGAVRAYLTADDRLAAHIGSGRTAGPR
jgi:hypothetical protein